MRLGVGPGGPVLSQLAGDSCSAKSGQAASKTTSQTLEFNPRLFVCFIVGPRLL